MRATRTRPLVRLAAIPVVVIVVLLGICATAVIWCRAFSVLFARAPLAA